MWQRLTLPVGDRSNARAAMVFRRCKSERPQANRRSMNDRTSGAEKGALIDTAVLRYFACGCLLPVLEPSLEHFNSTALSRHLEASRRHFGYLTDLAGHVGEAPECAAAGVKQ